MSKFLNETIEKLNKFVITDGKNTFNAADVFMETYTNIKISETEANRAMANFLVNKEKFSSDRFISCLDTKIEALVSELKLPTAGLIMKLLAYISEDDGKIKKDSKMLTESKIAEIADRPKSTVNRYLNELVTKGVLVEVGFVKRNTVYAFNEEIHSRNGVKCNRGEYFTKIWLSSVRSEWMDMELELLGLLYKIVPYFNTYTHFITLTPYEKDPSKALPLSIAALAKLVGVRRDNLSKMLDELSERFMVYKVSAGRNKTALVINPAIMYRRPVGGSKSVTIDLDTLMKQFLFMVDNTEDLDTWLALIDMQSKGQLIKVA